MSVQSPSSIPFIGVALLVKLLLACECGSEGVDEIAGTAEIPGQYQALMQRKTQHLDNSWALHELPASKVLRMRGEQGALSS